MRAKIDGNRGRPIGNGVDRTGAMRRDSRSCGEDHESRELITKLERLARQVSYGSGG